MDAVGRQRAFGRGRAGGQPGDQAGQIAAQQRLAAGEPHPVTPSPTKTRDQPIDLLEGQQVGAGQPHVLRLGHAVEAAQIAAIGHRHAQRAQRPVECIEHGHLVDYGIAGPAGRRRAQCGVYARVLSSVRGAQNASFVAPWP